MIHESDERNIRVDSRHIYVFTLVGLYFNLSPVDVENYLLSNKSLHELDKILNLTECKTLFFFRKSQTIKLTDTGETVDHVIETVIASSEIDFYTIPKCCCYILKLDVAPVIYSSIRKQLSFGIFDIPDGYMLNYVKFLSSASIPILYSTCSDTNKVNLQLIKDFGEHINRFGQAINSILVKPESELVLVTSGQKKLINSGQLARAEIDSIMSNWISKIESILLETERLPKHDDTLGFNAEVIFWNSRQSRLNDISYQIATSQEITAVLGHAESFGMEKYFERWDGIKVKVITNINSSKQVVKYLMILERYIEPLYDAKSPEILETVIPSLLNAMKMTLMSSEHYNTLERVCGLCVKVSNQVLYSLIKIISTKVESKNYNSIPYNCIWNLYQRDGNELVQNLQYSIKLNNLYQNLFRDMKSDLVKMPNVDYFNFSERYIFANLNIFSHRVEKLLEIMDNLYKLKLAKTNLNQIDELVPFLYQIDDIIVPFKEKQFDLAEIKNTTFDQLHLNLMTVIKELCKKIEVISDNLFTTKNNTLKSLELWQTLYETKLLEQLNFQDKLKSLLNNYDKDLDDIFMKYSEEKDNPPSLGLPSRITEQILFARNLSNKISLSMKYFQKYPNVFIPQGKHVMKKFNKLSKILLEFETLWHSAWYKAVEKKKWNVDMAAIKQVGNVYDLNVDPDMFPLIEDSQRILALGLKIPDTCSILLNSAKQKQDLKFVLEKILTTHDLIQQDSDSPIKSLLTARTMYLERHILTILLEIPWTANPDDIKVAQVAKLLDNHISLEKASERTLLEKIEKSIEQVKKLPMVNILLTVCNLNINDLIKIIEKSCSVYLAQMQDYHRIVLSAISEVVAAAAPPDDAEQDIKDLYTEKIIAFHTNYEVQMLDAVHRCIKDCLTVLKKRLSLQIENIPGAMYLDKPLLSIDVICNQGAIFQPTFEYVQQKMHGIIATMNNVFRKMVNERKLLPMVEAQSKKILNEAIEVAFANKDLLKSDFTFNSEITDSKTKAIEVLKQLNYFEPLWKTDKDLIYANFIASNPGLHEARIELSRFEEYEIILREVATCEEARYASLWLKPFVDHLKTDLANWKKKIGTFLYDWTRKEMGLLNEALASYISKIAKDIITSDDFASLIISLSEVRDYDANWLYKVTALERANDLLKQIKMVGTDEITDVLIETRAKLLAIGRRANESQNELLKAEPVFKKQLHIGLEQLDLELKSFITAYNTKGPFLPDLTSKAASERLKIFHASAEKLTGILENFNKTEALFGLPISENTTFNHIKKDLKLGQVVYKLYDEFIATEVKWKALTWIEIKDSIISFNGQVNEYYSSVWKLPKATKDWNTAAEMREATDKWAKLASILDWLTTSSISRRHWTAISQLLPGKKNLDPSKLTMQDLLNVHIVNISEDVKEICFAASKEVDIEQKLKKIIEDWSHRDLTFGGFRNRGNIVLRGPETAEVMTDIDESLMVLNSMMNNRYNVPFKTEITRWSMKLSMVSEVIEDWLAVQNTWIYLETVFMGGDIARQLPGEAKRFVNVDKIWVKTMKSAAENPNIVLCTCEDTTLRNLLPQLMEQLELCQKSLAGYLEKKRFTFPRFYFVSDPALLEILGQASDSHAIQPHLKSIFDNIQSLQFDAREYDRIIAMASSEGEIVPLLKPILTTTVVENWLTHLVNNMRTTLKYILRNAVIATETDAVDNVAVSFPTQVSLLALQLWWTRTCEQALSKARRHKDIMNTANLAIEDVLSKLVQKTTQDLSTLDRIKFETLVTIQVHQRDVFDVLVQQRVNSLSDFEWLKQSRFYWSSEKSECTVSITDVDFLYQYEYLGCTDRLVITPLTDRCYITLAQAWGMYLGGNPVGPAGTGKTETVKDLGKNLGKFVVVFNCSDQMDFRGLGKIFKGLAQSGCWGCFDEFNRIDLPVLSVAAQQMLCVLNARRNRLDTFIFTDSSRIELNSQFGIFITMNPGYTGRQELPENVKILVRSVAMIVPDLQIIIRVKLASCGFQKSLQLAKKFYILYSLCREQLSKQHHYDFGLRNILSVLRTLGFMRRTNPEESEYSVLMRVLRDMNVSKLIDEDEPLFMNLIKDLFPGLSMHKRSYPELEKAIQLEAKNQNIMAHPEWSIKLIQLYETASVRHGIMVLGSSGSGKSSCIKVLLKALSNSSPHREIRINPKAITTAQLFGRFDPITNDWTDGIFSSIWRRTIKRLGKEQVWIVLDGPVDSLWIESLNTVLDDNKMLTLANGDRLQMPPELKLVFEITSLQNASPATVSRAGMIYFSSSAFTWTHLVTSWLNKITIEHNKKILEEFLLANVGDIFEFTKENCVSPMRIEHINLIHTLLDILFALVTEKLDEGEYKQKQQNPQLLIRKCLFAIAWSLGGICDNTEREKIHNFMVDRNYDVPKNPSTTIYHYYIFDGEWVLWESLVMTDVVDVDSRSLFSNIFIETVDTKRIETLIKLSCKSSRPPLLVGEVGAGKTVIIKNHLRKKDSDKELYKIINFSSATAPLIFQRNIEGLVDKRSGNNYGPPSGKTLEIFIDDLSMPMVNEWGDQETNELVRQIMEQRGFYNLEKPGDWKNIMETNFISSMVLPGGGRNDIPDRLKRHFSIFNVTMPSDTSIELIYRKILSNFINEKQGFTKEVSQLTNQLITKTIQVWQKTKETLLPTPSRFHYVFNLRDLTKICEGLSLCKPFVIKTEQLMIQIWKHECKRVISDRFVSDTDVAWFEDTIINTCKQTFETQAMLKDVYFCDFLNEEETDVADTGKIRSIKDKVYEPVPSFDFLRQKLEDAVSLYNATIRGANMDLVLFEDAMKHLLRISRMLKLSQGNMLLVGVGGSGKKSLAKLASFLGGLTISQVNITKSYGASNFLEDIKNILKICGSQGRALSFVIGDADIKEERFLEYLNNLLITGDIPNLFTFDEMDGMANDLGQLMKRERPNVAATFENIYRFFVDRIKQNLHLILCFSPIGKKFRTRCLRFPGLLNGCTIDWFSPWPTEALTEVSTKHLNDFKIVASPQVRKSTIQHVAFVQTEALRSSQIFYQNYRRPAHVTPASFLSFINGFKKIYVEKFADYEKYKKRLTNGLDKLTEASSSIIYLQKDLLKKEHELTEANDAAAKVLDSITIKAKEAEEKQVQVTEVYSKMAKIAEKVDTDKAMAEIKLNDAKPALEAAIQALNQIRAQDIATIRKLRKPPNLIQRIMDCVLVLLKRRLEKVSYEPDKIYLVPSWSEALKVISQSDFLYTLLNYNTDVMNEEMCEFLEPYLKMRDFNMEYARKVCGDIAGLCAWVGAMVEFYGINKLVIPLKDAVVLLESRLLKSKKDLSAIQEELDFKQKQVDGLRQEYDSAMSFKESMQKQADACKRKMSIANSLISGLQDERIRWSHEIREYEASVVTLIGDALLVSAFLSYAGPYNQEFRTQLVISWSNNIEAQQIPIKGKHNFVQLLVDNNTIAQWQVNGLPMDELSMQNAFITTKASRFPLLVDPQNQGKSWVVTMEANNNPTITSPRNKLFRKHVEDAVVAGSPLIIEDVDEEIDPVLENLLSKNYIRAGRSLTVKIGDKELEVHPSFKLYVVSNLSNPKFSPELFAKMSVVNFSVTLKGLEDQLLVKVVTKEKNELERERRLLIEDVVANRTKLEDLENNLLTKLTNVEGNLVDDESLVDVLSFTKKIAEETRRKLLSSVDTEKQINSAREEYRAVAIRGSVLYFVMIQMVDLNSMYQISLNQFLSLFDNAITKSEPALSYKKRMSNIIEYLTYSSHRYMLRLLYVQHRLLFDLLLAVRIEIADGTVSESDFEIFLKGGAILKLESTSRKGLSWIPDDVWPNLLALATTDGFNDIFPTIKTNDKAWKKWFHSTTPELQEIPDYPNLSAFGRLLLVRTWFQDRLINAVHNYIEERLGSKFVEPFVLDLEEIWKESSPQTPLLCLLSTGSDPVSALEALANKIPIHFVNVAMGQGQETLAENAVGSSMEQGHWILLQNCHLSLKFLDKIMHLLLHPKNVHPSFRLWMTTDRHPNFPVTVLQAALKFTNQPPQGIKAGLLNIFGAMNEESLFGSPNVYAKPLIFTLAFFHRIVQERHKFGSIGWNNSYEFNLSDFNAGAQFLINYLYDHDLNKNISWTTIRYMICEVHYGGRVTDDYDRRLIRAYGRSFLNESIFREGHSFGLGYPMPPQNATMDELMLTVNSYMNDDIPEIFKLNVNANLMYHISQANALFSSLLKTQPRTIILEGAEIQTKSTISVLDDMLRRLPQEFRIPAIRQKMLETGQMLPLNSFLLQEISLINILLVTIRLNLMDAKLGLEGLQIINDNTSLLIDSIKNGFVPKSWKDISWDATTLGIWFSDLLSRHHQYSTWVNKGRPPCFWLPGFFNPQGFLTAVRQEVTREHSGWSLDNVQLQTEVLKYSKEEYYAIPANVDHRHHTAESILKEVFVYGLVLEGVGWDKKSSCLTDPQPKVNYNPLPLIRVYAVAGSNNPLSKDDHVYKCPVYKNSHRNESTFVCELLLRSKIHTDYWILQGACALLQGKP